MASIPPFQTTIKEGQPIIYRGETVLASHIETFKALNIYGLKANLYKFLGLFCIVFLLFTLLERFIYYFSYRLYQKKEHFILIYIVVLMIILFGLLFEKFSTISSHFYLPFLIPIPISAMVLSVMLTHNISLLAGSIISVFIALLFKGDLYIFLYLFFIIIYLLINRIMIK